MLKDKSAHFYGQKLFNNFGPQITSLIKEINRSLVDNKSLLCQILKIDPKFQHKLYQPIKYEGINQMFIRPLILRQLDQLMEQNEVLLKKKQMIIFKNNQKTIKNKQKQVTSNQNHFSFLRTVWSKIETSKVTSSCEKIDNLNKVIGMVKANIKQAIDLQENNITKQIQADRNRCSYLEIRLTAKNSQQIQRLKMRNQELQTICSNLNQVVDLKNNKIKQLEKQLDETENKLNESLDNLNNINVKLLSLKSQIQTQDIRAKRSHDALKSDSYLQFNSVSEDLKIKICSNKMVEINLQQTHRGLIQIIEFLRSKPILKTNQTNKLANMQIQNIPCLDLNQTISTNQNSLSERCFDQRQKFIPIRTQRSSCWKDRNKTLSNCQSTIEQCQQSQKMSKIDLTVKKFHRKAQFPLTSDRFRKTMQKKMVEQKRSLGSQVQQS